MRRIFFVLVVGVAQLTLFAGIAWAQGASFFDDFDSFDATRRTEGNLGRGYLNPDNVDVGAGNLRIKLAALQGSEILSNDLYGEGSYSARMQLPYAPSSVTAVCLYKSPDYESEIDIEPFNDSSRRIMFTTYAGGAQTHTVTKQLPFDPTAATHEYRFDYAFDSIIFYADGVPMMDWSDGLPQTSMHLVVNAWFPTWLEGRRPKKTVYALVDSVSYTQSVSAVSAVP